MRRATEPHRRRRPDPQVSRRFADARIHLSDTDLVAQDVLEVRDRVQRGGVFLVAPEKPRRDVYALLYGTLWTSASSAGPARPRHHEGGPLRCERGRRAAASPQPVALGRGDVFDERNPISDSAAFFGRGPLIHRRQGKILNRQNFGLYGLRKMGKTSLIFQLREGLPSNFLLLYIDLQGVASGTCAELCGVIADELRIQMDAKAPASPATLITPLHSGQMPLADALSGMDAALAAALGAMGQGGQDARILLVLDEIERMIPRAGHPGFNGFEEFFRLIRGMYQQRRQVVSAVVGADPTLCRLGKWEGVDNPVFQYYDECLPRPPDRGECDAMVQGLARHPRPGLPTRELAEAVRRNGGPSLRHVPTLQPHHTTLPKRPLQVTPQMVTAGVTEYLQSRSEISS